MDHIGIDVHKRESQIYILAEGGEVVEQRIRTEPVASGSSGVAEAVRPSVAAYVTVTGPNRDETLEVVAELDATPALSAYRRQPVPASAKSTVGQAIASRRPAR